MKSEEKSAFAVGILCGVLLFGLIFWIVIPAIGIGFAWIQEIQNQKEQWDGYQIGLTSCDHYSEYYDMHGTYHVSQPRIMTASEYEGYKSGFAECNKVLSLENELALCKSGKYRVYNGFAQIGNLNVTWYELRNETGNYDGNETKYYPIDLVWGRGI